MNNKLKMTRQKSKLAYVTALEEFLFSRVLVLVESVESGMLYPRTEQRTCKGGEYWRTVEFLLPSTSEIRFS